MKRTYFIFVFFVVVASNLHAQSQNVPSVGMVSYTFRNSLQKDMPAVLDTIQQLGIRNMEFSSLFGRSAADIRTLLDARGIRCTSFGVSYHDFVSNIDSVAANAKALGASYVRVATVNYQAPFDIDEAKKAVDSFNYFGHILHEKYNLTFVYHNHGYEFQPYENSTLFDYLLQHTNPQAVSFELDILWMVFPGFDPVQYLGKYPGRFKLMHVKDLKKGVKGDLSGRTPQENDVTLGTGQMDIPAIVKAAKKSGVQFFYIEDESPAYSQQVPESIKYLQKIRLSTK
jgi:sugar phosphate isomerase/epimerase